jgi:hypothetical protein
LRCIIKPIVSSDEPVDELGEVARVLVMEPWPSLLGRRPSSMAGEVKVGMAFFW